MNSGIHVWTAKTEPVSSLTHNINGVTHHSLIFLFMDLPFSSECSRSILISDRIFGGSPHALSSFLTMGLEQMTHLTISLETDSEGRLDNWRSLICTGNPSAEST